MNYSLNRFHIQSPIGLLAIAIKQKAKKKSLVPPICGITYWAYNHNTCEELHFSSKNKEHVLSSLRVNGLHSTAESILARCREPAVGRLALWAHKHESDIWTERLVLHATDISFVVI